MVIFSKALDVAVETFVEFWEARILLIDAAVEFKEFPGKLVIVEVAVVSLGSL